MCLKEDGENHEEKKIIWTVLDRMVRELFEEILISHSVNAIIWKHNWNIQRWDRAYHDLEENK